MNPNPNIGSKMTEVHMERQMDSTLQQNTKSVKKFGDTDLEMKMWNFSLSLHI